MLEWKQQRWTSRYVARFRLLEMVIQHSGSGLRYSQFSCFGLDLQQWFTLDGKGSQRSLRNAGNASLMRSIVGDPRETCGPIDSTPRVVSLQNQMEQSHAVMTDKILRMQQ